VKRNVALERTTRHEERRPLESERPKRLPDFDAPRFREGYQSGHGMAKVRDDHGLRCLYGFELGAEMGFEVRYR
jgi:hypothetical protein